jgi:hypothetical protein
VYFLDVFNGDLRRGDPTVKNSKLSLKIRVVGDAEKDESFEPLSRKVR